VSFLYFRTPVRHDIRECIAALIIQVYLSKQTVRVTRRATAMLKRIEAHAVLRAF
jgi:hypothetical protein